MKVKGGQKNNDNNYFEYLIGLLNRNKSTVPEACVFISRYALEGKGGEERSVFEMQKTATVQTLVGFTPFGPTALQLTKFFMYTNESLKSLQLFFGTTLLL